MTLLLEMLRAPHLSRLFFEVDLRKAPKALEISSECERSSIGKVPFDVESMGELPGVLATMGSLSVLMLRAPSQVPQRCTAC